MLRKTRVCWQFFKFLAFPWCVQSLDISTPPWEGGFYKSVNKDCVRQELKHILKVNDWFWESLSSIVECGRFWRNPSVGVSDSSVGGLSKAVGGRLLIYSDIATSTMASSKFNWCGCSKVWTLDKVGRTSDVHSKKASYTWDLIEIKKNYEPFQAMIGPFVLYQRTAQRCWQYLPVLAHIPQPHLGTSMSTVWRRSRPNLLKKIHVHISDEKTMIINRMNESHTHCNRLGIYSVCAWGGDVLDQMPRDHVHDV